jgi:hypothetical protein
LALKLKLSLLRRLNLSTSGFQLGLLLLGCGESSLLLLLLLFFLKLPKSDLFLEGFESSLGSLLLLLELIFLFLGVLPTNNRLAYIKRRRENHSK